MNLSLYIPDCLFNPQVLSSLTFILGLLFGISIGCIIAGIIISSKIKKEKK